MMKTEGKLSALSPYWNAKREINFADNARYLIIWSCLVDVWWFFYVVWYMWNESGWKEFAGWERPFHWVSFICGAASFLLKVKFFGLE
jgi:hypothetical protein